MRAVVFLIFLFATTLSMDAQAQEKVLFRYNPDTNDTIRYLIDLNVDMEGSTSMIMDLKIRLSQIVQADQDSDTFPVMSKIESVRMDMNSGAIMLSYDSANPDASDPSTPLLAQQLQPLLDADITVLTNDRSEVVEISGAEPLQGMIEAKQLFDFSSFPEHPVEPGDSWDIDVADELIGLALKHTLTYTGLENGLHRIDIKTAPDASASPGIEVWTSGFCLYTPQSFLIERSEITSKLDISGTRIINRTVRQRL